MEAGQRGYLRTSSIAGFQPFGLTALSFTTVTDAGLKELTGLTQLRLPLPFGTKTTDAGVAELRNALPKCDTLR